ncbi:TPA: hypothetical protein ACXM4A_001105 [Proteus mirabilis]|uniref:hypothetical protein n=1 Tax=Proteus mirabilis TaxID=584 RepID=UPI00053749D1|nr:hypothetical protein [Proteus mirabilis]AUT91571.1 hypothetical protein MC46_007560 [Proteus mirabilis]EJD6087605.1 hypothetical protein [Proteus mirabilis]ELZ9706065.1 hypothetical protein [Proteus mirabilis]MBG2983136.1 hypothetical protein [Proteus mirabilis]MBG3007743.1 hypothetical protein [Proteus mirabilis]
MSEELGRLTYFDVEKMGIYGCNGGDIDPRYTPNYFLSELISWVNTNRFENTLPTKDDTRLRKKIYCRNAYKCPTTGDYFFVLWKSEEDGNGNILGVDVNSPVDSDSDTVALLTSDGKEGKKYIWGKPCYYWYITSLNKFVAIKFPHSSTDTYLFASYIKDFVNYRMSFSGKKISKNKRESVGGKDFIFDRVTFSSDDGKFRTQFLFDYKMFMKKANRETLQRIRGNITHIVYRNTISTSERDERSFFTKLFDGFSMTKEDKPATTKEKRIELLIEETPTQAELNSILEFYDDGFPIKSSWDNIGFREGGKQSETKWFNEYVLRDSFTISYSAASKKHISAVSLANEISKHRDRFIAGLIEDQDSSDAANDDSGRARTSAGVG